MNEILAFSLGLVQGQAILRYKDAPDSSSNHPIIVFNQGVDKLNFSLAGAKACRVRMPTLGLLNSCQAPGHRSVYTALVEFWKAIVCMSVSTVSRTKPGCVCVCVLGMKVKVCVGYRELEQGAMCLCV